MREAQGPAGVSQLATPLVPREVRIQLPHQPRLFQHARGNRLPGPARGIFFVLFLYPLALPRTKGFAFSTFRRQSLYSFGYLYIYLFICLHLVLAVALSGSYFHCSIWDSSSLIQGSNPSFLQWEPGVLATRLPGKSHLLVILISIWEKPSSSDGKSLPAILKT